MQSVFINDSLSVPSNDAWTHAHFTAGFCGSYHVILLYFHLYSIIIYIIMCVVHTRIQK